MNLVSYGTLTDDIVVPLQTKTFIVSVNEMSELTAENTEPLIMDTVFFNGVPLRKYSSRIRKKLTDVFDLDAPVDKTTPIGTTAFNLEPSFTTSIEDGEVEVSGRLVTASMTIERMLEIHSNGYSIYMSDETLLEICSLITKVVDQLDDAIDVDAAKSSKDYILEFYDSVLANRRDLLVASARAHTRKDNTANKILENRKQNYTAKTNIGKTMWDRRGGR